MTPLAASLSVSVTSQRTSRPFADGPIASTAAEQVAEQIAERREDVFDVVEVVRTVLAVEAGVAVAIVPASVCRSR